MALTGAQSSEAVWCRMEEARPSLCPPTAVRSEDESGGGGPRSPRLCGTCPMLRGMWVRSGRFHGVECRHRTGFASQSGQKSPLKRSELAGETVSGAGAEVICKLECFSFPEKYGGHSKHSSAATRPDFHLCSTALPPRWSSEGA